MSMPRFSNWVVYFKSVDVTMYKDNVAANRFLIDLMNWFSCSLIAHIITAFHIIVCSFLTHCSKIKRKGWLAGWCVGELISAGFSCQSHLFYFLLFYLIEEKKKHHLAVLNHTCKIRCAKTKKKQNMHCPTTATKSCWFLYLYHCLQVNLAIMQKQLSEMAIGNPRQSSSSSRQNGFSGGVGALGIMNNRLAETSVDR